jgi:hypothetical protein
MNMQVLPGRLSERPPERQVISAIEVARLLRYKCRESFLNKRVALEAHGFPPKLPGLNGWSRPAIMRWLENNGGLLAGAEPAPDLTPLQRRFG